MSEPLVHVLILNWNGLKHLPECFASLLRTPYRNIKYVLLDNGSSDGSVGFLSTEYGGHPNVEIVSLGTNLGWSGGNNRGIARALEQGADYVFLLNNDTVTEPDAIPVLVETAEQQPETGALAPKLLFHDMPALINSIGLECSIIGAGWDRGIGRLDAPKWNAPEPVIGICGAACVLRANALRRAGLLPEDFVIYLDDLDLCLRIWNVGYEIRTCPAAVIRHKFGATMGQRAQQRLKYYLNTRNRFRLVLRHFPISRLHHFLPALLKGEGKAIGRALLDRDIWRITAHLRAWGAAGTNLPRAVSFRRSHAGGKHAECRFWPFLRTDVLFCPGFELPVDGWYAPRRIADLTVRPMSCRARLNTRGGRLRVTSLNCYPQLGTTNIEVRCNSKPLDVLQTLTRDERLLETPPGVLEFVARRVFDADATGERSDLGGWLAVEQ